MNTEKNELYKKFIEEGSLSEREYSLLVCKKDNWDNNTDEYKDFFKILEKIILKQNKVKILTLNFIHFPLFQGTNIYSYIESLIKDNSLIKEIQFYQSEFYDDVIIKECLIKYHLHFQKTVFHKQVVFNKSKIKQRIDFYKVIFKGKATFMGVKFKNEVHFWDSKVHECIHFNSSIFSKVFSLKDIQFKCLNLEHIRFSEAVFSGISAFENKNRTLLKKENLANKETARIIKYYLEKENNITESNKYFILEQELYLDELNNDKKNLIPHKNITIFTLYLNKFVSGFGLDWVRSLLVIFIFGFMISSIYTSFELSNTLILFNKVDSPFFLSLLGLFFSFLLYFFYHKENLVMFIFMLNIYIALILFNTNIRHFLNDVSILINPLNIFKLKDYFECIAPFGMLVKLIMATLIYQFIMAFRQNTRRK